MATLGAQLDLKRCPHCNVDQPSLVMAFQSDTTDYMGQNKRYWRVYKCNRCGGLVTACSDGPDRQVHTSYPGASEVEEAIPDRARHFLEQALNSLHAPSGAVMLSASAVDAMLKVKGYKDGTLYSRIDKDAGEHIITSEMAKWAHEVRLDANDQRHVDESAPLPTPADAQRALDFAIALGQFMFVLPARVQRGLENAAKGQGTA